MKKIFITLAVFTAGLSFTVQAAELPAPVTGNPMEAAEINSSPGKQQKAEARKKAKARRCQERKQRMQKEMEAWKQDMENFRQRRNEDKHINSLVDSLAWVQAKAAVHNMSFVLEADYVTFKNGSRVSVNSGTNFISVNGDRAIVQISPSTYYAGPNGVGGVTVKGRVNDLRTTTDKKGRTTLSMSVTGIGINAQVEIYIYPGSNRVTATVMPNFNSNSVSFDGTLVPYSNASVFEGMSL
ncbi:MAG: DUF4251 domain-containing protein [Bacteroidales bacterium]|nr:DUF4251 domain-containing protein [Bacteroides sp.]MCM1199029.1 DUF4251 domain-containing protein [Clostridium sp.]MCM1501662.1 DUF4251 domain-containing protein [Bacteroidales bacterium]